MKGMTHSLMGIGIFLLAYYLFPQYLAGTNLLLSLLIVFFYSRLPDIDQDGSTINKFFTLGIVALGIYGFVSKQYLTSLFSLLIIGLLEMFNHRTYIHSIVAGIILSLPLYFLSVTYFIIGLASFIIHLIADKDLTIIGESR